MDRIIIHVDMDAFYASVETRDNPALRGKPLIIGSLPQERGVVATCSYEARRYGVHSAMNVKEAYRLCPNGIYMHPDFEKYRAVSSQLHEIWNTYATAAEYIALDEAYLDVTRSAGTWERACGFAREIKRRTREELSLTCSVGIAYSKTAAKTASEEKKPDGYFEIPTPADFVKLIIDRDVRVLYTVGAKTAEKLNRAGIRTVRDIQQRQEEVIRSFGKQGQWMVQIAHGIDDRAVSPYNPEDAKSISREITFQEDVDDYRFIRDVLLLLSISVERRAERVGLYGEGVTLKLTYSDMKSITRSRLIPSSRSAAVIYAEADRLLDQVNQKAVRLVGVGVYHLVGEYGRQMRMDDYLPEIQTRRQAEIDTALAALGHRYGLDFAGNLDRIFHGETLYRTIEYMRKHRSGVPPQTSFT
ncbi:MAG: DNA polymerase IV [Clostridia bacterium]|nr:DNA polymerase IV [Clostridia bacterium]